MKRVKVTFGQFAEPREAVANGAFRATWKGAVLAESERTVVIEGNSYFPPKDVDFGNLEHSTRHTVCPMEGNRELLRRRRRRRGRAQRGLLAIWW